MLKENFKVAVPEFLIERHQLQHMVLLKMYMMTIQEE